MTTAIDDEFEELYQIRILEGRAIWKVEQLEEQKRLLEEEILENCREIDKLRELNEAQLCELQELAAVAEEISNGRRLEQDQEPEPEIESERPFSPLVIPSTPKAAYTPYANSEFGGGASVWTIPSPAWTEYDQTYLPSQVVQVESESPDKTPKPSDESTSTEAQPMYQCDRNGNSICEEYRAGICRYGDRCRRSHPASIPCPFCIYLGYTATCNRKNCLFRHKYFDCAY